MLLYLVVYDIPCNKRRKKVANLLEGYGQRVQYSVFECILQQKQYQQLYARLIKCMNEAEDNIRLYPITRHTLGQVKTLGVGSSVTSPPSSIIV